MPLVVNFMEIHLIDLIFEANRDVMRSKTA